MPKYTIEIDDGKNRSLFFGPMTRELRGRFSRSRSIPAVAQDAEGRPLAIAKMPDIPGLRVEIDTDAKRARIYDPLALPENKKLLEDVNVNYRIESFLVRIEPVPELRVKLTDAVLLNGWLLYCRRLVKDGMATLVDTDIWHVKGPCRVNFNDFTREEQSKTITVITVDTESEELQAEIDAEALAA